MHFCSRTLHRTAFDYSPPAAHPFGAGATGAPFNASGVSPSRAPLFKEPSLWLGFCFSTAGLSIELRSIIRRQRLTPSRPARQARRSTPSALVRAGHHYLKNPPKRRFFAFLQPDSPSNCVRLLAAGYIGFLTSSFFFIAIPAAGFFSFFILVPGCLSAFIMVAE